MNTRTALSSLASVTFLSVVWSSAAPQPSSTELRAKRQELVERITYLTDSTYDHTMRQTKGLVYVLFFKKGKVISDEQLFADAGAQTNRFKFFKVDLENNPELLARLKGMKLVKFSQPMFHGDREVFLFDNDVIGLLAFDGAGLDHFGVFENIGSGAFFGVQKALCNWIHTELDRIADSGARNAQDAAVLIEAIEQVTISKRGIWSEEALEPWRALKRVDCPSLLQAGIPALVRLLPTRFGGDAACVLGRVGRDPSQDPAPIVQALIKQLGLFTNSPAMHLRVPGRELPEICVIQALGAIGRPASNAVPLLVMIADREFSAASQTPDRRELPASAVVGFMAGLALREILPPAVPKEKLGQLHGEVAHVTTGVVSNREPAPGIAIWFWGGRTCYGTVSDQNGRYEINLPPGPYVCGWAGSRSELWYEDHSVSPWRQSIVHVAKGTSVRKNIAATVIFTD